MVDAIVVLACGIRNGHLSEESKRRVEKGVKLFRKFGGYLVMSGSQSDGVNTEAELMKRYASELGVPTGKIIMENNSKDTITSAYFVNELCKERKWKDIIIVTSLFHVRRTKYIFESSLEGVSAQFRYVRTKATTERERKLLELTKKVMLNGSRGIRRAMLFSSAYMTLKSLNVIKDSI